MKNMVKDDGLFKLKNWIDNSFSTPYKFNFDITNKCNASCLFCERAENKNPDSVSDKEWMNVIAQGIKLDVMEWWITGSGEPLSRSKLILKIFETVKKESPSSLCKVTTNGSLFTDDIIQKFVKIGVDNISISLDSPGEKTHDFLRGKKGIFKKVMYTLTGFNHWKNVFNSNKPKINFNTVLTSQNYNQLNKLVDLASKFGITNLSLNPLRISKSNIKRVTQSSLRLTSKQKKEAAKQIQLIQKNITKKSTPLEFNGFEQLEMGAIVSKSAEGFDDKLSRSLNFKDSFLNSPCFEPWLTMSFNYNGDVNYCTSCGYWKKAENIKDKSLKDIWFGDSFKYIRSCILQHKPSESCFGCGIKIVRKNIKRELDKHFKNV